MGSLFERGGRRGTAKMRGIFEVQTTHCRVKFHSIKCFPNFKKNNLNEKLFGKPWDKQSKIANAMAKKREGHVFAQSFHIYMLLIGS